MKNIEAYITHAIQRGEPFDAGPGYGEALSRDHVWKTNYDTFSSTAYFLHGKHVASYIVSNGGDRTRGDLILFVSNMSRLHAERLRAIARAFEVPGIYQKGGTWYWEDTNARCSDTISRVFQITDKPLWVAPRPDYHLEVEG